MNYKQYSKIILPTIDTVLCRGPSIFAQPPADVNEKRRVLLIMPRAYWEIIRDKNFRGIVGYDPKLDELFQKTSEDLGMFIDRHWLTSSKAVPLDNSVDVKFVEARYKDNTTLVKAIEKILKREARDLPVDVMRDDSIFAVQATLTMARADIVFNGLRYEIPRYKGLGPEISDKFLVEIDTESEAKRYSELMSTVIEEPLPRTRDDEDYPGNHDPPGKIYYIPVEKYSEIMEMVPIANQFLVMRDINKGGPNKVTAYRLKFDKRRFERVDLDARVEEISHIWRPKLPLDLRQKLALDILLDDDITMAYIIGGKQTGKTSLAMAAFESRVFGRGTKKDRMEVMITLIKSGLPKDISDDALLAEMTSFHGSFMEQKIGILPFDELCEPNIKRTYLKDMVSVPTTTHMTPEEKKRDAILLPQHQIFRLMHPKKEDGESFPGFTIRDECQNEYPHIMNKFRDRRGPGAKYAILGDIYDQISRPGLDEYWNGLLLNLSKNMGLEHVACITLTEKWSDRQLK